MAAALTMAVACSSEPDVRPADTVEGHVVAAVAAAQDDHVVLLDRICTQATGEPPRPLMEGDEARWFQAYPSSSESLRDVARELGVDVVLSNHPQYDGTPTKVPALDGRGPGDSHPYVIGTDAVARYLTVAAECGKTGLLGVG